MQIYKNVYEIMRMLILLGFLKQSILIESYFPLYVIVDV